VKFERKGLDPIQFSSKVSYVLNRKRSLKKNDTDEERKIKHESDRSRSISQEKNINLIVAKWK